MPGLGCGATGGGTGDGEADTGGDDEEIPGWGSRGGDTSATYTAGLGLAEAGTACGGATGSALAAPVAAMTTAMVVSAPLSHSRPAAFPRYISNLPPDLIDAGRKLMPTAR